MDLPIFINGLLPNTRDIREGKDGGSRVYIKIEKNGEELFSKILTSDSEGKVELTIPDTYAGANILLRIRHQWYLGIEANDVIPDFGYFYTAKIQHDFTNWSDSPSPDPEWKSEEEYIRASAEKNLKVRHYRHKNWAIRIIYYSVMVLAPFVGLVMGGPGGVTIGFVVAGILELISPYSIGIKKLKRRK
ncbi:MAG: hypothetical protein KKH22_04395 [Proteobacteria bacterium]|nr:hypothetical protein [Pseudomonadota bacterium]